ncbi:MAG: hypothetical protein Q9174_006117 [Haloplaca sp. 1 TL-2023]
MLPMVILSLRWIAVAFVLLMCSLSIWLYIAWRFRTSFDRACIRETKTTGRYHDYTDSATSSPQSVPSSPGLLDLTGAELDMVLCMKLIFNDTYRRIGIAVRFNERNSPRQFDTKAQRRLAGSLGKQVNDIARGLVPQELERLRFWVEDEWSDEDLEGCYELYRSGIDRYLGNFVDKDDAYWDVKNWTSLEAREKEKDRRDKVMTEMGKTPELSDLIVGSNDP